MRILIYIEPHIIRNNPLGMYWVFRAYTKLATLWKNLGPAAAGHEIKITAASPHYEQAKKEGLPIDPEVHLRLPSAMEKMLPAFRDVWSGDTIRLWTELLRGEGDITDFYVDGLELLYRRYPFDCIVYWGTNGAVTRFAASYKITAIGMEQGCTRSPFEETLYCDFLGVNGNAFTRYLNWAEHPAIDLEGFLWEHEFDLPGGKGFDGVHDPVESRWADKIYECPDKNVLVVLQLDDDSNCLVHSDFTGMADYTGRVLPKLVDAGFRCFVKPHPGAAADRDRRPINWETHEDVRVYCADNFGQNQVIWLDDVSRGHYVSLLDKMHAIVTVNSSVGFEAMLLGKPVVAMGRAAYSLTGLLPELDDVVSGFDKQSYIDRISRAINLLWNHYLVPRKVFDNPVTFISNIERTMMLDNVYYAEGPEKLDEITRASGSR